ncbi:MAG: UvrD-helicase domain-containing protein [Acidobacteria bacterium]|nr:UvrD-helicase domain-containing protein [Acidobacteriota bacterium]
MSNEQTLVSLDPQTGFTEAQLRAVLTLDRPVATTAGPGAGKTRVLVNRYMEILSQPNVDIDNIVAITFTTKAANQMRERIRTGMEAKIEAHRGTDLENTWREYKRHLDAGVITTIHGFCSRLLREYPIEAGVDPHFSILDEYTSSLMLNAAAEQAVTNLINNGGDSAAHLVAAYGRSDMVGALERLYNQLRGLGVRIDEAQRTTDRWLLRVDDYRERLAEVSGRVAQVAAATGLTPTAREKVDTFLEAWGRYRLVIEASPSPERTTPFIEAIEHVRHRMPDARTKALKESVLALRELFGHKDFGAGKLMEGFFDVCARLYMPHLVSALRSIDFLYSDTKRSAQALDYEDLQLFARDLLVNAPDVRRRASARYRYFLVDEFQDTNRLQREIIGLLALDTGSRSAEGQSLFLVGDRKQSIYNFRGAEVEVFEEAIQEIQRRRGEHIALDVNFRSDSRLIRFFNGFFSRLMRLEAGEDRAHFLSLGFVEHEPGIPFRTQLDDGPAVEFLYYVPEPETDEEKKEADPDDESLREIEARRLAARVKQMVENGEELVRTKDGGKRGANYKDFAVLLGAFTQVKAYEQAFQRAGVPYYVVAGRGFYSRPEVLDLLTLLEFLDNRTDEISLAAILRSPLFGISDETLYSLRWAEELIPTVPPMVPPNESFMPPTEPAVPTVIASKRKAGRPMFAALLNHANIANITGDQHALLAAASETLQDLMYVRNRLPLSELIERAIRRTQYDVMCAAAEDGPQRLSNLDKLIGQARGFEQHEARLLRDFVEYIRNFRRLEGREAEAQLELGLNAVAILTVHKSKGLEFPIVVIPDLNHKRRPYRDVFLFDRDRGLAFQVPDQRGGKVATALYAEIQERLELREQFESMRQLYVGMTRAEDYLILSAASRQMKPTEKLIREQDSWLRWLCTVLGTHDAPGESVVECGESHALVRGREIELSVEPIVVDAGTPDAGGKRAPMRTPQQQRERQRNLAALQSQLEQQMEPVPASEETQSALHYRYSVTQLVNYLNCPRQYYFARFLQMPDMELKAGSGRADDAEAREGRARLSPTLRGTIVHRFCELFREGDDLFDTLRQALEDIRQTRVDEWADELAFIDDEEALKDLWPLAKNYVYSALHQKVEERWQAGLSPEAERNPALHPFVKSEMSFALRTDAAMILGSVDKLLISEHQDGLHVHVIDFKTNTLWKSRAGYDTELAEKAAMYRIQMQAYSLAAWWLLPNVKRVEATLHFLHPNLEYHFPADQLSEDACHRAVLNVAKKIRNVRVMESTQFEANPGARCLNCRFAEVCTDAVRM